jgi:thiamine pyrophosphokinase
VHGVVTHGLQYPLQNETLWPDRARGISNVMAEPRATINIDSGRLLCVHVRQTNSCLSDKE